MCVFVCVCVFVYGCGREREGIRAEGGWSTLLVRPAPLISIHFYLSGDH